MTVTILLHLASGQKVQTEDSFPGDEIEDVEDKIQELLSKRGSVSPWRMIGHILIHPANVLAVEIEQVNVGTKPQKGA